MSEVALSRYELTTGESGHSHVVVYFAKLRAAGGDREVTNDVVVDVDTAGTILGIEILDGCAALSLDPRGVTPLAKGSIKVSYDSSADAFYLRLLDGVSKRQHVIAGLVFKRGELMGVDVDIEVVGTVKDRI